ncbi:MAG: YggS family pyridoxal phosphate-dependent enzyme [Bacilli bacterium]|nr:YggS family pyridoxal phosphate-dependent enzyme [Bacilli bacterium]
MQVREDLKSFINTIPNNINIVAATKYIDIEEMKKLLLLGINNFGENRVDVFLKKYEVLKREENIHWHFIGHLQRNKATKIINKIEYLHSLDSLELAKLIDEKRNTPLKVFVEISINKEATKNGIEKEEAKEFINILLKYKNINVVGLMMMSMKNSPEESLNSQFLALRELRDKLEEELHIKLPYLSMGMSDDYLQAISQGATHIRLGRILFKE